MNVNESKDGKHRATIRVEFRADANLAAFACIDADLQPEHLTRSNIEKALRDMLFKHGAEAYYRQVDQQDYWNEEDQGEDYDSRLERLTQTIREVTGLS